MKGTPATPSAVVDNPKSRNADLAVIHMAIKALGWGDDEYRDILWTVCNVRSSAALDFAGRKRFLDHLRRCGFHYRGGEKRVRTPFDQTQAKLWALWQQLADAKLVDDRRASALDAWVKRQTGVDRMVWLNKQQLHAAIESAKAWLGRA